MNEPAPAADLIVTLRRWGVRTFGEFAALPAAGVSERLGEAGLAWQRLARGEDPGPLVSLPEETRYEESQVLEWPIEGLEPLSFVLGRLLETLCARLMRDDRGAATLSVRLRLVTREMHARTLQLPLPFRDPRVLRTLAVLDLESHPPPAAIDVIQVEIDPVPGRVVQSSLLDRARPSAEQLSTLRARIQALMGEGRSGAPHLVDTHRPGAFVIVPFEGERRPGGGRVGASETMARSGTSGMSLRETGRPRPPSPFQAGQPASADNTNGFAPDTPDVPDRAAGVLRRFRHPVPARVAVRGGCPVRVLFAWGDLRGGEVQACAGPWRTSGDWWRAGGTGDRGLPPWDHDEWDVALASGGLYRIYRDRTDGRWYLNGVID
jgi:protein ImuB